MMARIAMHPAERMARFAELVADEVHPEDASAQLGCSRAYGRVMMQKLRRMMGEGA